MMSIAASLLPQHLARILIYYIIKGKLRVIGERKATGPYKSIYTKRVGGLPTNCRRYDRDLATLLYFAGVITMNRSLI